MDLLKEFWERPNESWRVPIFSSWQNKHALIERALVARNSNNLIYLLIESIDDHYTMTIQLFY